MILRKKVERKNLYRDFVSSLNGIYSLCNKEQDLFALLIDIDKKWPDYLIPKNIIDTRSRKYIMHKIIMHKNNLTRYLTSLKKKNILVELDPKCWVIHPKLMEAFTEDTARVTIIFES